MGFNKRAPTNIVFKVEVGVFSERVRWIFRLTLKPEH